MIEVASTTEMLVPSSEAAPVLPVEVHIVGSALAANVARSTVDQVLFLIRNYPRNETAILAAFADATVQLDAAWTAYQQYRAVGQCQGQA